MPAEVRPRPWSAFRRRTPEAELPKTELAAKSEDNKKLRASLSEQTPPATPHVRSKKDGKLSRFFQHFGRRSSGEIE